MHYVVLNSGYACGGLWIARTLKTHCNVVEKTSFFLNYYYYPILVYMRIKKNIFTNLYILHII